MKAKERKVDAEVSVREMDEVGVPEAAQILDVSVSTLYDMIRRGLVRKHKRSFRQQKESGKQQTYFIRSEIEFLRDHPEITPETPSA